MLKILSILSIILLVMLSAYFINGGWAQNIGELYRNYKESRMSFSTFVKTIMKSII